MQHLRLISAAGSDFESDRTVDGVLEKGLWWAERIFGLKSCAVLLLDEEAGVLRMFKSRGIGRPTRSGCACARATGSKGVPLPSGPRCSAR